MPKTAMDNEDWESQLTRMMGERDAEDIARAFRGIIDSYEEDEPAATLEVMVGEDDVHAWLPAIHKFLTEVEVPEAISDVLWNVGLQLCQAYTMNDDVAAVPECTDAVRWFMSNPDDDEDEDDDDDD